MGQLPTGYQAAKIKFTDQNKTKLRRSEIKLREIQVFENGEQVVNESLLGICFSLFGVFSTRSSSLEQVDFSSAPSVILKSGSCSPVPVRAETRKSNCRRARFPFLCSLLDI